MDATCTPAAQCWSAGFGQRIPQLDEVLIRLSREWKTGLPANDNLLAETRAETIALAAPQPRMAHARRGMIKPFARRGDGPTGPPAVYHRRHTPSATFRHTTLSPLQRKLTVSPVF